MLFPHGFALFCKSASVGTPVHATSKRDGRQSFPLCAGEFGEESIAPDGTMARQFGVKEWRQCEERSWWHSARIKRDRVIERSRSASLYCGKYLSISMVCNDKLSMSVWETLCFSSLRDLRAQGTARVGLHVASSSCGATRLHIIQPSLSYAMCIALFCGKSNS
jgi:hypothetical protein